MAGATSSLSPAATTVCRWLPGCIQGKAAVACWQTLVGTPGRLRVCRSLLVHPRNATMSLARSSGGDYIALWSCCRAIAVPRWRAEWDNAHPSRIPVALLAANGCGVSNFGSEGQPIALLQDSRLPAPATSTTVLAPSTVLSPAYQGGDNAHTLPPVLDARVAPRGLPEPWGSPIVLPKQHSLMPSIRTHNASLPMAGAGAPRDADGGPTALGTASDYSEYK
jgi:anti-sigma factor RsiW